ncbi:MAG: methyltransferase domain-containing protein [Deltaproteobacteria bacterium]|nr:methyltransferase domain-containing protein [Deltaproteobacteria bacterium]MBT6612797.1 methyltransferase domain-containing protein [Deltaproteobacteria bacterium]
MGDWNPELYLQFKSERTQPSIDLISRINQAEPRSIIDMGCGPGNSTQALVNRWPKSQVTGLDGSAAMIQQARQDFPHQEWIIADATTFETETRFDLVFSNAAIQWIPNHEELLTRLFNLLSENGTLAIQIPLFLDMPLGKIINKRANDDRWRAQTEGVLDLFTIHDVSFYYDILSKLFNSIEMWETNYMHVLNSHGSIMEMMSSTGLKPYLERLYSESDKNDFKEEVLKETIKAYPSQMNGKVLLPFKRLFFIGYK